MKYADDDIKTLMEQNSPKKTVISFLLACVYGAAALPAALKIRSLAEIIAVRGVVGKDLMINQYGGIVDVVSIFASAAAIAAWLITFVIVWHGMEKSRDMKARMKKCTVWTAAALCIFGLSAIAEALI